MQSSAVSRIVEMVQREMDLFKSISPIVKYEDSGIESERTEYRIRNNSSSRDESGRNDSDIEPARTAVLVDEGATAG